MSETIHNKENKPKRSSLKSSKPLNPNDILTYSKKRNSVSIKEVFPQPVSPNNINGTLALILK